MSSAAFSIGPGAITEAGTKGGPAFVLSKAEWIAIQTYVIEASALPITDEEFRRSLGKGAPKDLSDFVQLITAYKGINGHCKTWKDATFPQTVKLADAIVQYGMNTAPVYYPPILTEAKKLADNPGDEDAKKALKGILNTLQGQARESATKAEAAVKEIKKFADDTHVDKDTLVGPKGNGGLAKLYNDKYGKTSKEEGAERRDRSLGRHQDHHGVRGIRDCGCEGKEG